MSRLLRIQFAAFTRRKALASVALLLLVAVLALGGYELFLVAHYGYRGFPALSYSTRYLILWPVAFVVLAYEFISQGCVNDMEEMILAHGHDHRCHLAATAFVPMAVLLLFFGVYVALRIAVVLLSGLADVLLPHVLAAAVIDVLAPSLIALMLGAALASRARRFTAYAAIAFFVFLIGPFSEFIPSTAVLATLGSGKILDLYPVFRPFWILPPDPRWGVEASYGFPIEAPRWTTAGYLLSALGAVELPRFFRNRWRSAVRLLLCLVAVWLLSFSVAPASVIRHEDGLGNTANIGLEIYYEHGGHDRALTSPPHGAVLAVTRYDMRLAAKRDLRANVTLAFDRAARPGRYVFTLYHGYRVSRIVDDRGGSVPFTREGDWVYAATTRSTKRLTFVYGGSGGAHWTNSQGVFLPWYFPYYPVPGALDLWDERAHLMKAAVLHDRPVEFSIDFQCPAPIASNLRRVGDGRFAGRSRGAVFVGGLLRASQTDGRRVIWFPADGSQPDAAEILANRIREMETAIAGVRDAQPASTVIQMPENLASVIGVNAFKMDDVVFTTFLDSALAPEALLGPESMRYDRQGLRHAFLACMAHPEAFRREHAAAAQPAAAKAAEMLLQHGSPADGSHSSAPPDHPADPTLMNGLLCGTIDAVGQDAALRETYRYLNSDDPRSAVEFLMGIQRGVAR